MIRKFPVAATVTLLTSMGLCLACDAQPQHASEGQQVTPKNQAEDSGTTLESQVPPEALDRLVARNEDAACSLPTEEIRQHMQEWQGFPVGKRIALWANLFQERGDATYLFGLKEEGYVTEGLLVQDFKPDCVLFFYRCTDLARASTPREAILQGLETRFQGAATPPVDTAGRVDYKNAAHLDYSLDIVRSGVWGREVTTEVGIAVDDAVGTSRYPANSFRYVPSSQLRMDRLQDGDHLFFVLNEASDRGQRMRQKYGLVVGHQGIVVRQGDQVYLVHAASKDLPGVYDGNQVVKVLLRTYLDRVESHKGVLITRVENAR